MTESDTRPWFQASGLMNPLAAPYELDKIRGVVSCSFPDWFRFGFVSFFLQFRMVYRHHASDTPHSGSDLVGAQSYVGAVPYKGSIWCSKLCRMT